VPNFSKIGFRNNLQIGLLESLLIIPVEAGLARETWKDHQVSIVEC